MHPTNKRYGFVEPMLPNTTAPAPPQPSISTSFDVNSFLRKTLSSYGSSTPNRSRDDPDATPINNDSYEREHLMGPHHRPPVQLVDERYPSAAGWSEPGDESVSVLHMPLGASAFTANVQASVADFDGALPGERPARFGSRTSLNSQQIVALCRICHLPAEKNTDPLISPCRCNGSMKHVHRSCLVHWLEICSKKICPIAQCELCGYVYKTHGCMVTSRVHLPHCSPRDRVFHIVFILVFCVMVGCAAMAFLYLQKDPNGRIRATLNTDDVMVIICSILFFCSFFIAVFTQYRAEASLGRMMCRCCTINKNWRIKNYERRDDPQFWSKVPMPPSALKKTRPRSPPLPNHIA